MIVRGDENFRQASESFNVLVKEMRVAGSERRSRHRGRDAEFADSARTDFSIKEKTLHESGSTKRLRAGCSRPDVRSVSASRWRKPEKINPVVRRNQSRRPSTTVRSSLNATACCARIFGPIMTTSVCAAKYKHEVSHRLQMWRRDVVESPASERMGLHRARVTRRAHLVYEIAAVAHRYVARHDAQDPSVFCTSVCTSSSSLGLTFEGAHAPLRRRVLKGSGRIRRRQLHRHDRCRGHPRTAQRLDSGR